MKRFGMSFIPIETSTHQERAGRENSIVANASNKDVMVDKSLDGKPIPILKGIFYAAPDPKSGKVVILSHDPYFKYDDNKVHYDSHVLMILSNEFKTWPVGNQMVLINHCDMHHFQLQAQEQEMIKAQMAMAAAGQKPTGEVGAPGQGTGAAPLQQAQATEVEPGLLPVG